MLAIVPACGQLQPLNVITFDSNVLGRTGTFCAIFTTLEQFEVEQVIDVFQTVKLLRIMRPGIVEDLVSSQLCNCSYADMYKYTLTIVHKQMCLLTRFFKWYIQCSKYLQ